MTQKEREDRFIEECRQKFGVLTWESELLLRCGYGAGAAEMGHVAYVAGTGDQRDLVLDALGASARKRRALP